MTRPLRIEFPPGNQGQALSFKPQPPNQMQQRHQEEKRRVRP